MAGYATVQSLFCVTSLLSFGAVSLPARTLSSLVGTVMGLGWELSCTIAGTSFFPDHSSSDVCLCGTFRLRGFSVTLAG